MTNFPPPPCKHCGEAHSVTLICKQQYEYIENYFSPQQERLLEVSTKTLQGILSNASLLLDKQECIDMSVEYANALIKAVKHKQY